MKESLLNIVQEILSDSDSDEINSIDDTTEATQAAYIVRGVYRSLVTNSTIDYFRRGVQFDGLSDARYPNYLKLPDNIQEMCEVWYDRRKDGQTRRNFKRLIYLFPDEFIDRQNLLNTDKENVLEIRDFGGLVYYIQTDKAPEYWTSFDDTHLVFDSFDNSVENTVHKNKSQAVAYVSPKFELEDDSIPDLPADMFPYLIAESKAQFSAKIRQMQSVKDEQWSTLHRRRMSRKSWQAGGRIRLPDYGKQRIAGRKNPYFDKSY